jgi:hypothetical protein
MALHFSSLETFEAVLENIWVGGAQLGYMHIRGCDAGGSGQLVSTKCDG